MRKGLKLFATGFVCASVLAMNVNAEEINVTDGELLEKCVAKSGNVCKLGADIELSRVIDIAADKKIILDLNGHSIKPDDTLKVTTGLINIIHGGTLIVNDSGENGIISAGDSGNVYAGIQVTKKNETDITKTATLVVNDGIIEGYWYGIVGNGSADRINTSITINGGTIKSLEETCGLGIYHPQEGILTVTGGEIHGKTGIEMRSGTLTVTGGTIIGDANSITTQSNSDGSTTVGAGIAIAQHTTKKDINVTISGGTIKGYVALHEKDTENVVDPTSNNIKISITGGTFEAINGGTNAVYSEDVTNFITNGIFNTDITKLADGTETKYLATITNLTESENGYVAETTYEVTKGEEQKVTVKKGTEVTITIDAEHDLFKDLYINNKLVDKKYYTTKSGSTIITLNADYVETLEKGNYEVTATFTNGGTATTDLTIVSNEVAELKASETKNVETKNPKTSDNIITYIVLSILSVFGLTTISKRIYKNQKAS